MRRFFGGAKKPRIQLGRAGSPSPPRSRLKLYNFKKAAKGLPALPNPNSLGHPFFYLLTPISFPSIGS